MYTQRLPHPFRRGMQDNCSYLDHIKVGLLFFYMVYRGKLLCNVIFVASYWIKLQVDYKVLHYTYKALNNHAPPYINEMMIKYELRRSLRSSCKCMLVVPKIREIWSRSCAAAVLWNDLCADGLTGSDSLAEFVKTRLKTNLFNKYFQPLTLSPPF